MDSRGCIEGAERDALMIKCTPDIGADAAERHAEQRLDSAEEHNHRTSLPSLCFPQQQYTLS